MKKNPSKLFGARRSHINASKLTSSGGSFRFWLGPVLLCALLLFAAISKQSEAFQASERTNQSDPVVAIGSDYENSIQLLNNRFRVDNDVDEITMIFFREQGSAPIVLVKPDGSKLSLVLGRENKEFTWFETDTYDMITIKKPMPGPWQAVGQILPESKIMVIADIGLNVQPIPSPVYSGEIIKQTATLTNAGQPIDFTAFRDVITLNIDFVSANNPNYENFGLGARRVASFQDNGTGFDESGADGVFTGQFDLNIPPGEWRPTFSVVTPMYTREIVNENVVLLPNPILISVDLDETKEGSEVGEASHNKKGSHIITVDVNRNEIDMRSLIYDGIVRYPNGDSENVSFTYFNDEAKTIEVTNSDFGTYRFKMTAYATNLKGRDIVLDVPEFSFRTEAPPPPPPGPTAEELEAIAKAEAEIEAQRLAEIEANRPMTTKEIVIAALLVNSAIIVIGGIVLFIFLNIRNNPNDHLFIKLKSKFIPLVDKLKSLKKKNEQSEGDADKKDKKSDAKSEKNDGKDKAEKQTKAS